jgi:hypothetical protein
MASNIQAQEQMKGGQPFPRSEQRSVQLLQTVSQYGGLFPATVPTPGLPRSFCFVLNVYQGSSQLSKLVGADNFIIFSVVLNPAESEREVRNHSRIVGEDGKSWEK